MFAGWLNLEELIVLAESMMRRDGRLRRTTIEELTAYLEALRDRPEMRALFRLSQNATREDVETAVTILEALRSKHEDT